MFGAVSFSLFSRSRNTKKSMSTALPENNIAPLPDQALSLMVENLGVCFLYEDVTRHIVNVNHGFCSLFGIPVPPQQLIGSDCSQAAAQVKQLFLNPTEFVHRIDVLMNNNEKVTGETLRMTDGRVLLRDFIPVWDNGIPKGYLWTYIDITKHTISEEMEVQQAIDYFAASLYDKHTAEEILWDVARNCISKLGFTDCVIYLKDVTGKRLVQTAAWGPKTTPDNKIVDPIEIPVGIGIVGAVAKTGIAEIIQDTSADVRYIIDDAIRASEISVPIVMGDRVLGVIDSEHEEKNFFSQKHLSILSSIASLCAIKIVQIEADEKRTREIQQQKVFYEEILNNIPADIAVFSPTHEYLFVNPMGIKNDELRKWIIGKKDEDYCDLRNRPYTIFQERRAVFNQALETKKMAEWEEQLAKPEGDSDYHLRRFYPVLDAENEVKLVIGYGLNITQRKQYEQQIRITEKRYNSLFNFSQFLINTHDLNGMLLSINPAALKFLGYTAEEMIGHNIGDFIAADTDFSFEYYLHSIHTNNKAEGILPVRCKDGRVAHLLSQVFKVEEPGTEPYMIGFAQDISERIRTEQLLISAKQLAEKTTKAKEDFMAKVSHEIRTPLNGILGVAGLLSKTPLDPQQEKYMTVLQESGQNLLSIINDLLDIGKIVSGKMLLEHVSFDLNEKMEILLESFRSRAAEKKLGLSYQTNIGKGEHFTGDPFRITQVLNNLLSNAVKFTLEGSVSLVVTASKENSDVVFEVVDSGIGIPADKVADIYEPFIQTHAHSGIREMGTGLGLTICRELVELMKGTIHVNSNNSGTVFTVTLPLRMTGAVNKPVQHTPVVHDYSMVRGRRFLLAEDVELNQFLISEIMNGWSAELVIANNGQEAVDLLQQLDFDMILMDIQMPVLDGLDATRLIRKLTEPAKRDIPVIALTANTFVAQDDEYLHAGMNDFLSKPFSEKKLYEVICRQLKCEQPVLQEAAPMAVPVNAETPLELDFTYLKEVAGDNQPFIDKMVRSFRDNTIRMLEELRTFELKEDWAEMAAVMHKLKFSVNTMGIHAIKQEVIEVESVLKNGPDHASVLPRVEGLRKRLLELTVRL